MIEIVKRQKREEQSIGFDGFPLGENTSVDPSMIERGELAECFDLKIKSGGRLENRSSIVKHTSTAIGTTAGTWTTGDIKTCSLNGTYVDILSAGSVVDGYDIMYLSTTSGSGVTPIKIDDVMGQSQITPYNDVAVISDGSYLKYCDSVSSVKLAYDSGPDGSFFDNYDGDVDGVIAITTSGVGCTFTTPNWDTGFTIPPTQVYFYGQGTTAGTSTISVNIITTAGAAVSTTPFTATIPTTAADMLDTYITTAQVSAELQPNTKYHCLLVGEYFNLSYTTATAGGLVTAGGATADTSKNPIMRVHPGLPPKSGWSIVSGTRLWVYDPDRPGGLWYGNLSHLDFSTVNGGGWIGVADQDQNSFKVGGAQDLYGELYIYGTESQPYMSKKTGATPNDFSLPILFQRVWATQKTIINTGSDLWSASSAGIDSLTGVQEYGDLRYFDIGQPIKNRFSNWATSTAFSGYYANDGQYWFYMPNYQYVNVCHTKIPTKTAYGDLRYPWSRYDIPCVPSCFSQCASNFLIGSTDGYIYKINNSEHLDLGTTQIYPKIRTAYMDFPFSRADIIQIQFMMNSSLGVTATLKVFINGNSATAAQTSSIAVGANDTVTIGDISSLTIAELANIPIIPGGVQSYLDANINAWSFQIEISSILINGYPVYINGALVKYQKSGK